MAAQVALGQNKGKKKGARGHCLPRPGSGKRSQGSPQQGGKKKKKKETASIAEFKREEMGKEKGGGGAGAGSTKVAAEGEKTPEEL